jgi:hypothetical protein
MNKIFNKLLITSTFCILLANIAGACDKHKKAEQDAAQSSAQSSEQSPKKFDYTKITKDLPDTVKKEVEEYYEKTDTAYDTLSEDAKKAVKRISKYKSKVFSKKVSNEEKKPANS